jgi:hypothetical protein
LTGEWALQLFVVLAIVIRGAVVVVRQYLQHRSAERILKYGGPGMRIAVRSGARWSVDVIVTEAGTANLDGQSAASRSHQRDNLHARQ